MSDSSRLPMIEAGLRLYPQTGYQKLSVRLLAAEVGLSPGMFHHAFASKDEFIAEVLQRKFDLTYDHCLAKVETDAPVIERLRQTVLLIALAMRGNLDWIQRLLADSTDGVDVIRRFLSTKVPVFQQAVLDLLDACERDGLLRPAARLQRFAFLMSSVLGPILIGTRMQREGMLSAAGLADFPTQVLGDEAIAERVDWALAQLGRPTADGRAPSHNTL